LTGRGLETIEVAFFGGSFTGISISLQSMYLSVAKEYKDKGLIDKIHLSTRPDYIDTQILDNLKYYGVDIIELGVQSFDEEVLKLANRGHNSSCVYESAALIKNYGFELGLQLMIGLPGDSLEKDMFSAKELVKINPSIARLYPTIVIKDTRLYEMYLEGSYIPLRQEEAVHITKEMYKIISDAGINIIRVGLKSTDVINDSDVGAITGGTFHPAFRQLVEGEIAKDLLECQLIGFLSKHDKCSSSSNGMGDGEVVKNHENIGTVYFCSSNESFSNMVGNSKINKKYFAYKYPYVKIEYIIDNSIGLNTYILKEEKK
jgi:histone acetyltransferase (RNA polymerase elongator complex component)